MEAAITPCRVRGTALAPASKSYTHRAVILAALARGRSALSNCLVSDDTLYTIAACKALGARVSRKGQRVEINGTAGRLRGGGNVFVGNSGTTIRLMASVAALADGKTLFDGTPEMRRRPMQDILGALKRLGVAAESVNGDGCPPLHVHGGGLAGGEVKISGETSSQFISSLLVACPYARRPTKIKVLEGLKSKPYVDVTLDLMGAFGIKAANKGYREFLVPTGRYSARRYKIEGDYSSAAYFFAAAAITGSQVSVAGLNPKSVQGDREMLAILERMGCAVKWAGGKAVVRGPAVLKAATLDMADFPDLVPTVAAVAAFARGKTRIAGIGHLRFKETDRLAAPAGELAHAGVPVRITRDSMEITGMWPEKPVGAVFDSHKDHRMAMSMACLALGAQGPSVIEGTECVSKSFPDFFARMRGLGAKIALKK